MLGYKHSASCAKTHTGTVRITDPSHCTAATPVALASQSKLSERPLNVLSTSRLKDSIIPHIQHGFATTSSRAHRQVCRLPHLGRHEGRQGVLRYSCRFR
ncbi:hypothetical protein SMACR_12720 [Sordaria macrospora]|uniref:Uncharacterized protein n=1 Tax=Sordaria macrospora TaxID=5147 RepID=A0A8S9A047_SORMA|nr:hypothetical protein SMACR_12720 [Sordaria macrospora]WPJ60556.1 hypothetical protein SMAC4_12720 [Sordaria macrospora]